MVLTYTGLVGQYATGITNFYSAFSVDVMFLANSGASREAHPVVAPEFYLKNDLRFHSHYL